MREKYNNCENFCSFPFVGGANTSLDMWGNEEENKKKKDDLATNNMLFIIR